MAASKTLSVKNTSGVGAFRLKDCSIPTLWCGDSDEPPEPTDPTMRYSRAGTRTECMKKGFGVGMYTERKKKLPSTSLQQIKYVGETYEKRFIDSGIEDIPQFVKQMRQATSEQIEALLTGVLINGKTKTLDQRAYNAVMVFLFQHGVSDLPACKRIAS